MPIGSRRRRAVIKTLGENSIPFTQLPYQCFQEARKVLAEDREEKIKTIELFRSRIARLIEADPVVYGGEENKQRKLDSMRRMLEQYKILADINDPLVKKKFEDGHGMIFIIRKYRLPRTRSNEIHRRHEQANLPLSSRQRMA
jgi:large subunit ribosomal protein L35